MRAPTDERRDLGCAGAVLHRRRTRRQPRLTSPPEPAPDKTKPKADAKNGAAVSRPALTRCPHPTTANAPSAGRCSYNYSEAVWPPTTTGQSRSGVLDADATYNPATGGDLRVIVPGSELDETRLLREDEQGNTPEGEQP